MMREPEFDRQPTRTAWRTGLLLAFVAVGGCEDCKDDPTVAEACEGFVMTASDGFPTFVDAGDLDASIGFQPCDSKVGDLNGDGMPDFVAADHINAGFGYFMQSGPDAFAQGVEVAFVASSNSAGVVLEDFNFDGIPDVANSAHAGFVTVRINATPAGAAIADVDFPSAGETNIDLDITHSAGHGYAGVEGGLVAADFNDDGKIDIATANLSENADGKITASFMLNTTPDPVDDGMGNLSYAAAASFDPVQYIELPGAAISIDKADFNGDGSPDVVTSNTAVSSLSILINQTPSGASTVAFDRLDLDIPEHGNSAGSGPTNPVAADFDSDGWPDVAVANWNVDTVSFFRNATGDGGATNFETTPFEIELCFNPLVVRAGDLDQDGDPDIVVVPLDLNSGVAAGIIENQSEAGSGTLDLALVQVVELPERMQQVDFLDWLANLGSGDSPGVWFPSTGNAADFDGDGAPEILLAVAYGNFAIEIQADLTKTDDILEFVTPPISQTIANSFLPDHSELLLLEPQ